MSTPVAFVSHSHLDNAFCLRMIAHLSKKLPSAGVFYSTRDVYVDNFVYRITSELVSRPIFIVILSPNSVISPWVGLETDVAIRKWVPNRTSRSIIPVLHLDTDVDRLNGALSIFHTIDCRPGREAAGFDELAVAVQIATDRISTVEQSGTEDQELLRAFEETRNVASALRAQGANAVFPKVKEALDAQGVDIASLGYGRLGLFLREAETRGYIRVVWQAERSVVLPPDDEGETEPLTLEREMLPVIDTTKTPALQKVDPSQLLAHVDFLEKSLPYVTSKGIVNYVKKYLPAISPESVKAQLELWKSHGDLEEYQGELCTNDTGKLMAFVGVRINRQSVLMRRLLQSISNASASSWQALSSEKKAVLIATYLLLAEETPYFYWHQLHGMLSANDSDTDWNTVFRTSVDAGALGVFLTQVPHPKSGTIYTIKRVLLNENHPDVKNHLESKSRHK